MFTIIGRDIDIANGGAVLYPHYWTIVSPTGAHIASPCKLIEEAREQQAKDIVLMCAADELAIQLQRLIDKGLCYQLTENDVEDARDLLKRIV